ncbi:predicted protein [Sclerotinia sclerotiorum 1980 UF-70]|uniref:Uncharacterized protein n=1 Tax=Sclerotinia sclerotiorum (strain ATCC 18683 / 1980 / Ss-1) TaxID=665079 RepID=A7EJB6_SCLS1|nr:predicted protein [Sclerotinia sclerotiorum 1980 UF-70]EDO02932.1 predicted protein [Sclerotinia sclerotiorum 1980 UF-70]
MLPTLRKIHSNLPSHSHSHSPTQDTPPNKTYKHSLYLTTSTSLLTLILILISLFYQFPGPNSSLLDIVGSDITYKIYMFQYCVSGGENGNSGLDRDVYAPNGEGCHLDFNPIGYVVSATKIHASDSDLHLFHSLTAAAFSFCYIGIHIQILLTSKQPST